MKDWCLPRSLAHNAYMTITYPDATVRQAIILAHDGNLIRAIAPGGDDVMEFRRIHGGWVSDDLEPVTLEFEWQRKRAVTVPSEDDCVCSPELADQLIQKLMQGDEAGVSSTDAPRSEKSDLGNVRPEKFTTAATLVC